MRLPEVTVILLPRGGDVDAALALAKSQRDVAVSVVIAEDAREGRPAAARNAAARTGPGMWLAFMEEGDRWAPDRLARGVAAAQRAGAAWSYSARLRLDAQGRMESMALAEDPAELRRRLARLNVIGSLSAVVVRADAFAAVGGLDERLRVHEPWVLYAALAARGRPAADPSLTVAEITAGERLASWRWPQHAARELNLLRNENVIGGDTLGRLRGFAAELARGGRATAGARLLLRAAVTHRHPSDLLRAALIARTPASDPNEAPPWAPPAWLEYTA